MDSLLANLHQEVLVNAKALCAVLLRYPYLAGPKDVVAARRVLTCSINKTIKRQRELNHQVREVMKGQKKRKAIDKVIDDQLAEEEYR